MTGSAKLRNRFAARIEAEINTNDMPQWELAKQLGYENANIITMFKKGTTRVPLSKVAPRADALEMDVGELMRAWFITYAARGPSGAGEPCGAVLTDAEKSWIRDQAPSGCGASV
jgi:hypothetical protein